VDLKRVFLASWRENGGREAIVDGDSRLTFDQLLRRSVALSNLIRKRDRSETGHIGIILPSSDFFVTSFIACLAADKTAVPLNFLLSPTEVAALADHANIRLVLTLGDFRPLIEGAKAQGARDLEAIFLDELVEQAGPAQFEAALEAADPRSLDSGADDPNRPACILYTSGTTGDPKGVVLSHRNLAANCEAMRQVLDVVPEDVFMAALPLFHSYGMTTAMILPLFCGCKIALLRRFHPTRAVELIERERVTALLLVPSLFALLMRVAERDPSRLTSVRIAISGGGPLPPSLGEEFRKRAKFTVHQGYGLTEASPVVATNYPGKHKPESVGPPLPGVRVEIRDENDRPLGPNQTGEICVAGDNVMLGYYRNPEATRQVLDERGWLRTGDLGHLDEEGFLYVTGRKKDLIIFGGENIYPQEIENVLVAHPAIAEAAVVGVSDKLRGEYPRAYIVLNEGASVDEGSLRRWCAERLASYKIPREFNVVEALPKNTLGKVVKSRLLEQAES